MTRVHQAPDQIASLVVDASRHVPEVTLRSPRSLRRAARRGRLLVAHSGVATDASEVASEVAGWAIAEPCGRGVNELGMLVVLPAFRDGEVLKALTEAAVGLRERSVVVTMDPRFAQWLLDQWQFRRVTLWQAVTSTRAMFLARRLSPGRLRIALARVSDGTPIYLVRDGDAP